MVLKILVEESNPLKTPVFYSLMLCLAFLGVVKAQADTATQRKAYTEINAAAVKMKQVKAMAEVDGLGFELKAWREDQGKMGVEQIYGVKWIGK